MMSQFIVTSCGVFKQSPSVSSSKIGKSNLCLSTSFGLLSYSSSSSGSSLSFHSAGSSSDSDSSNDEWYDANPLFFELPEKETNRLPQFVRREEDQPAIISSSGFVDKDNCCVKNRPVSLKEAKEQGQHIMDRTRAYYSDLQEVHEHEQKTLRQLEECAKVLKKEKKRKNQKEFVQISPRPQQQYPPPPLSPYPPFGPFGPSPNFIPNNNPMAIPSPQQMFVPRQQQPLPPLGPPFAPNGCYPFAGFGFSLVPMNGPNLVPVAKPKKSTHSSSEESNAEARVVEIAKDLVHERAKREKDRIDDEFLNVAKYPDAYIESLAEVARQSGRQLDVPEFKWISSRS